MSKILIITEKPTQAREYAKALGNFTNYDGYMKNEKYFITWCFGHLIELEKDTVYREGTAWSKEYLPLLPEKLKYSIARYKDKENEGKKKQIEIIKSLMNKSESIINATDADREGELIFLYVYNYFKCKLPFQRLWLSSLTDTEIKKGFKIFADMKEFKNATKFEPIKKELSISDANEVKIKSLNQNNRQRASYREACICWGQTAEVYAVETPYELKAIFETNPDELAKIMLSIEKTELS